VHRRAEEITARFLIAMRTRLACNFSLERKQGSVLKQLRGFRLQ
jgi:hypothetical protein